MQPLIINNYNPKCITKYCYRVTLYEAHTGSYFRTGFNDILTPLLDMTNIFIQFTLNNRKFPAKGVKLLCLLLIKSIWSENNANTWCNLKVSQTIQCL